jgi:hypothetical protein
LAGHAENIAEEVERYLQTGPNENLTESALRLLGTIGNASNIDTLAYLAKHGFKKHNARNAAINALTELKERIGIESIYQRNSNSRNLRTIKRMKAQRMRVTLLPLADVRDELYRGKDEDEGDYAFELAMKEVYLESELKRKKMRNIQTRLLVRRTLIKLEPCYDG